MCLYSEEVSIIPWVTLVSLYNYRIVSESAPNSEDQRREKFLQAIIILRLYNPMVLRVHSIYIP